MEKQVDHDLQKLFRLFRIANREDLINIFKGSRTFLNESNTFGSRYYSTLSEFVIYLNETNHEKASQLSKEDFDFIFNQVLKIYPLKESSPEITNLSFEIDFELLDDNLVDSKLTIDDVYINQQIEKARTKLALEDYDGVVTNCRTLLETVCILIIEKVGNESVDNSGDLPKLFKQCRKILGMQLEEGVDLAQPFKEILTGTVSIMNGIAGIRNSFSDSHGRSTANKRYSVDKRHAEFIINISFSLSHYLIQTMERKLERQVQ